MAIPLKAPHDTPLIDGIGVTVMVGVAIFAVASTLLMLTRFDGGVSFIWLTNALIAGAVIRRSARRHALLAGGFAGIAAATALFGVGVAAALPMAAINLGEVLLMIALMRRLVPDGCFLDSVAGVGAFATAGALIAPAASALPAAFLVSWATHTPVGGNVVHWFAGHALGYITVMPLVVLARHGVRGVQTPIAGLARVLTASALVAVALAGCIVFGQRTYPLLFLPILPMLAATIVGGRLAAVLSVTIVTAIGSIAILIGSGPILLIHAGLGTQIVFFQFYIAVVTLLVLPIAALLRQRELLLATITDAEERFRLLADHASDIVIATDRTGNIAYASPSLEEQLGFAPDEVLGSKADRQIDRRDRGAFGRLIGDAVADPGIVAVGEFRLHDRSGREHWLEARSRAIADQQGEIETIVTAARDVTDRRTLETALRDAVDAKSAFLANMSHEVRTPMNAVIGFVDLLLATRLTDEQRRMLLLIADSGHAMMRLLNDILDLSKVEAGQMAVNDEEFDVRHAIAACAKLVQPACQQKHIELVVDIADEVPRVIVADGLRLRQILLNLLGNAIKFTPEGRVTIAVRLELETLRIAVSDTGIGIASDRQAAIFEAFVQADRDTTARFGGTGLGLAISARLASLMGGRLMLEHSDPRGSRFVLTLPLQHCENAVSTPASAPLPMPDARRLHGRVLVAEDHDVNRALIAAMLDQLGVAYDLVGDGAEAIEAVTRADAAGQPYALILMDMRMPVVDGLEATARIRRLGHAAAALPIVALTANAYPEDIAACLGGGMQAHLAKPVTIEALRDAIERWAALPTVGAAPPVPSTRRGFQPSATQHARYCQRRAEVFARLTAAIEGEPHDAIEVSELVTLLHNLAGTAAMFGEPALGTEASRMEGQLETIAPAEVRPFVAEMLPRLLALAA